MPVTFKCIGIAALVIAGALAHKGGRWMVPALICVTIGGVLIG